jgi:hypothetical protein
MGYRSQVAYAVRGKKEDVIPVLMTLRLEGSTAIKEALNELSASECDGVLTLAGQWSNVKWYPDYKNVTTLTAIFEKFKYEKNANERSLFDGAFVRIGEDDSDVETDYWGDDPYDLVSLNRTVHLEVPYGTEYPLSAVLS